MEILRSVDFWKFAIPLLGAVLAWFLNEWQKRIWEQYQRKEASYKELVRCLRGFYVGESDDGGLKAEFLNQLNLCWLYCPDDVIKKGYDFLSTVHAQKINPEEVKSKAMGEFVAAVRRDLLSRKLVNRTDLTGADIWGQSNNSKMGKKNFTLTPNIPAAGPGYMSLLTIGDRPRL